MKKTFLTLMAGTFCALAFAACGNAGSSQPAEETEKSITAIPSDSVIKLMEPSKHVNVSLMQALSDRQSIREYSEEDLSLEELSSLLWAANGVNREDGKRTAPSAVNAQDIDLYVCLANGAYLYNAKENQLERITTSDLRQAVAGRQPMQAPLFLVLVADLSRYPERMQANRSTLEQFAAMDAGYVSANIGLYCAAAKLATVPRASMDKEELAKALRLSDTQIAVLNNPVGHVK